MTPNHGGVLISVTAVARSTSTKIKKLQSESLSSQGFNLNTDTTHPGAAVKLPKKLE
jgi:hypothetical protein